MSGPHGLEAGLPGLDPVAADGLGPSTRMRLAAATVVGLGAGLAVGFSVGWRFGLLGGWIAGAAVFVLWTWLSIGRMDGDTTARHCVRDDPGRGALDVIVIFAALASLIGIVLMLAGGNGSRVVQAVFSVLSIASAWTCIQTLYTVTYARLYYTGTAGGIDFNSEDQPQYSDFAYLAFTLGMTYQVSDTDLKTRPIRAAALRHALLSFLFGTVIIATTINLVAGLTK